MEIHFFKDALAFRKWLEKNHYKTYEIWVGFYKVNSGIKSIGYSDSVDQALCYGWIDGIRKSIDEISYCNRFTPRKKNSKWSDVNLNKVKNLLEAGLMKEAGIKVFNERKMDPENKYSFEKESVAFDKNYLQLFKSNKKAWDFFTKLPPSYKKMVTHWVMSAKQEKTQRSRLEKTIDDCQKHIRTWDKYKK
jgi:uncharacterized protein YdeI (YjbR/CyaY-like superfamily)